MNNDILISIIIPVKNGDCWLNALFQKLMQQSLYPQAEIIVIDSGSTDKSIEIIKRYPVKLVSIPSHEFNHGGTRNVGANLAKGKYVVMTVQDAIPETDLWLEQLISGFVDDKVAGVCGQQIVPHDLDKNPVLWYRPVSAPQKSFFHIDDTTAFLKLSPQEQRQKVGWDNVNAAYRRDVLMSHPFQVIDFAEDICWAKDVLLKGYTLAYVDEARVYHYHHHLPQFILPRYFSVYYFEYKLFNVKPAISRPIMVEILSAGKILIKESKLGLYKKVKWLMFNIRYWLVVNKTIKTFNKALSRGEQFLDLRYQTICNKPPQAPKY